LNLDSNHRLSPGNVFPINLRFIQVGLDFPVRMRIITFNHFLNPGAFSLLGLFATRAYLPTVGGVWRREVRMIEVFLDVCGALQEARLLSVLS
jgi:hypothetical protein